MGSIFLWLFRACIILFKLYMAYPEKYHKIMEYEKFEESINILKSQINGMKISQYFYN